MDYLRYLDRSILFYLNGLVKESEAWRWVILISARYLILIFFIILIYLWLAKPKNTKDPNLNKKIVVSSGLSFGLAFLINAVIEVFINRSRPFITYGPWIEQLDSRVDPTSFPSSHTYIVFAIATSIYISGYRRLGALLFILGLIIGVARIAAGVHYPSDIAGGIVLGIFAALVVHYEGGWLKKYLFSFRINPLSRKAKR